MPIYEYQCEACGSVFEKMQKFADAPLTVHEVCGGPVHKLMTAPAFQFKGTGWYITDYGRGGTKQPGANGGESKAGDGKSDKDAKSDKADSSKSSESSKSDSSSSSKSDSTSTPAATAPATKSSDK